MKKFGFLCYTHNQWLDGDTFVSRSWNCIFVGYPYGKKWWKLYDLESKEFSYDMQQDNIHMTPPISYDTSRGRNDVPVPLQGDE